jgi:hypothetical protein
VKTVTWTYRCPGCHLQRCDQSTKQCLKLPGELGLITATLKGGNAEAQEGEQ